MKESKSKKARSITFSIILVLSGMTLMVSATTNLAPNKFSGDVTLNGAPAPINTNISAFIGGELRGTITVESSGEYGDFDGLKYMDVTGSASDNGKTITFTVGGAIAGQTAVWTANAGPQILDLSAGGAPSEDVTPLTISIRSPSLDQAFKDADINITVSGSVSDNVGVASVEVKLGSGSWDAVSVSGTGSWSKDVTLDTGPNTIYARANDTSGRTAGISVTVYYTLSGDTTDPNISITTPPCTVTDASITIRGNASDDEDLYKVEVKVESGECVTVNVSGTTASWSKTVTLTAGPNTISATAFDISGNHAETSIIVVYNPPDITGDPESPGGSTGGFAPSSGATSTGADTQPASWELVSTTPTITGTSTPATTSAEESGAEPEEKNGQVPGFEAMFAIAGLLAVIYMLRRR